MRRVAAASLIRYFAFPDEAGQDAELARTHSPELPWGLLYLQLSRKLFAAVRTTGTIKNPEWRRPFSEGSICMVPLWSMETGTAKVMPLSWSPPTGDCPRGRVCGGSTLPVPVMCSLTHSGLTCLSGSSRSCSISVTKDRQTRWWPWRESKAVCTCSCSCTRHSLLLTSPSALSPGTGITPVLQPRAGCSCQGHLWRDGRPSSVRICV